VVPWQEEWHAALSPWRGWSWRSAVWATGAARAAGEIVGLNNRGVGLMGQFNWTPPATSLRVWRTRIRTTRSAGHLAIATLNRQQDGDVTGRARS
jgi:hypothetical protein